MSTKVGVFTGSVSDPWPCWCEISDRDGRKIRFSHGDLSDLEYLIQRMKKTAKQKLPDDDRGEV